MNDGSGSNKHDNDQSGTSPIVDQRRAIQPQNLYRELYELAPIGYFVVNLETTILDVNKKGAELFNTTREKLLGIKLTALINKPFEHILDLCKTNMMENKEWRKCEVEMVKQDGSKFFAVLQGRQLANPEEIVIFLTDITHHRLTENALIAPSSPKPRRK